MSTTGSTGGSERPGFQPDYSKTTAASETGTEKFVKSLGKGKNKTRMGLSDNKTYNIAAKLIDTTGKGTKLQSINPFYRARYVRVKEGGKTYDVNIRSAAKRLGISKKDVRQLAKGEGGISRMQEKTQVREEAVRRFNSIINNYVKHRGKLQTNLGEKTGLRPKTLLSVMTKGLEIGEGGTFKAKPMETFANNRFVRISGSGEVSVLQRVIGEGSYGAVFQTFNINRAKAEAMKEAHVGVGSSEEQLKNENIIHLHLRDGKKEQEIEGIQSAPREVTTIGQGVSQKVFYQTDLAQGSLENDNPNMNVFQILPQKSRLNLCGQIFHGLRHAHSKNVVHADIKPANCLMRTNEKGIPERFGLADWGGAAIDGDSRASTASYRPSDYDSKASNLKEEGQKADVFSTSLTLIEVLSGGKRPPLKKAEKEYVRNNGEKLIKNFPRPVDAQSSETKAIQASLKKNGIDKAIIDVLIQGLGPKDERPTADELSKAFDIAAEPIPEEPINTEAIEKLQLAAYLEEMLAGL